MTRGGYVFYELLARFFYARLHVLLPLRLGTKQFSEDISF